jgi:hypothetical protein
MGQKLDSAQGRARTMPTLEVHLLDELTLFRSIIDVVIGKTRCGIQQ